MPASSSLNPADVRRAAMDLLARREHGFDELACKLRRRFKCHGSAAGVIDSELDRLKLEGLQSDERFAAAMVRQLIGRGLGPRRLDQELRAKGVRQDWQECADCVALEVDWFDRAQDVFTKKFGAKPLPSQRDARLKERMKRARFMQYRGFELTHFKRLLDDDITVSSEDDEL